VAASLSPSVAEAMISDAFKEQETQDNNQIVISIAAEYGF
jgi:hypothetical protein